MIVEKSAFLYAGIVFASWINWFLSEQISGGYCLQRTAICAFVILVKIQLKKVDNNPAKKKEPTNAPMIVPTLPPDGLESSETIR